MNIKKLASKIYYDIDNWQKLTPQECIDRVAKLISKATKKAQGGE